MELRPMTPQDWPEVARIYRQGMDTGVATFETSVPDFEAWDQAHLPTCRTVAISGDSYLGWVALSPASGRCVYGGVAEISVYVASEARGQGIGLKLLRRVIVQSEAAGIWSLQSGIFPENKASIRIHEAAGFRYIGYRERIGKRDGAWKDNLLYERRSTLVGTNTPH